MSSPAQRPTPVPEIVGGVALAAVSHAALIALLVLATGLSSDEGTPLELDGEIVSAELLMWGEVMPEDGQLPWIANPEPAPPDALPPQPDDPPEQETTAPPQEVVDPTPPDNAEVRLENEEPENQAQPEDRQPEAAPRRDRGETNPNRPTNNDPVMGSPDGYVGGTSLSADAQRNAWAQIITTISSEVRRPSTIPDSVYATLSARVHIRVTTEGRISSWNFLDRSGNTSFDAAVETALNVFRRGRARLPLSSLPPELREAFIANGVNLRIRP